MRAFMMTGLLGRWRLGLGAIAMALVLLSGLAGPATAQDYAPPRIVITDGNVDPMPIAIADFVGQSAAEASLGQNLAEIIRNNLERSGLFAPIDKAAFIEQVESFYNRPRFGDWRLIQAQVLVTGQVVATADGQLQVYFRVWDVFAERDMLGLQFTVPQDLWRRVGHLISDQVYEQLTGEQGYFDTRVVYIAESGPKTQRVKRLMIMDQDGANPMYLTDGSDLVLTPRFSPVNQEIVYISYEDGPPRIYLRNIESGEREVLGEFPGMSFAPRFSPDGEQVIMTLTRGGNADVYSMNLRTRVIRRLTQHPGIDTSPSYSPDGEHIVFNSDRGGSQQLYVMRKDGSQARRISFGEGKYATPVWSPRGDLIAFTKIWRGQFYIGVMSPDGEGERLLTQSYLEEGPTWAPNGRVLLFFRTTPTAPDGSGGSARLWSVDLTGHNQRQIPTPTDASDPAWSPLLSGAAVAP